MTPKILLVPIAAWILAYCAPQIENVVEVMPEPPGPSIEIVTRAEWGWVALTDTIPTHEIKYITIHHGGEDFPEDKDVINYLMGLQSWSRSDKNWIDNPYHYMIDLQGKIYEARPIEYPGDTNTDYDVRGHALVCVMGNYENQILSGTQFEQLALLTATLADKYGVANDLIKSHKDYTETLCPGKDLYRYLEDGSLIQRVTELRKP
ncbi:MAG: N-acetylmuramoyl-L-alanine amidase [FCB group bacterium]|nr:N-acetylmuramoyl-L-alanine amidase [FCB group bacterium]MBL7028541.1 N-acetylmuramoyl-L-alanine amidase [Candidatus Neomarinimicrobiota bacterium]MBL7120760.1 N-acetylmuramoyl-L-alanine amidase [Candidatus Neomarinimicrobiota bacterium]